MSGKRHMAAFQHGTGRMLDEGEIGGEGGCWGVRKAFLGVSRAAQSPHPPDMRIAAPEGIAAAGSDDREKMIIDRTFIHPIRCRRVNADSPSGRWRPHLSPILHDKLGITPAAPDATP